MSEEPIRFEDYKAPPSTPFERPLPFHSGGGGDTFDGMERVWEKLREHDKRFDRIESELSTAKFWFVGVALASVIGMAGVVFAVGSHMASTMSTALSAIQTVISAQPAPASSPQQPTIIVVPMDRPAAPELPPQ